ncbi:hypothetical protein L3Y34_010581 [Caenorhabditis briggsae]|uniref:Protein kinase domain-containing protein n=1 Tax=Caenorhabditis briggsae TaxID=6238 RepID=A0AAE8ZLU6_CAEBR|nr:hypothetical protein L3Y34_010581 [Caenorhabditis briggsae]
MKNEKGFTDLLDYFIIEYNNVDHFCMVIPYQGETFARVLERSTASSRNAVRIAFHLFTLLKKVHAIGFVHSDVHYKNVLMDMSVDGILEITIINFGVCEPINPPQAESRICARHQIIHMCLLLILQCVGITPFLTDKKQRFDKKSTFHANPYQYFPSQETTWIADLYTLIENQRESGYHYNSLLDLLDEAVPGVGPSAPIEYRWRNNTFLLA